MNNLFEFIFGIASFSGLMIFLGKTIITKSFDVSLKKYQNDLELIKIEHQVKYSKLHEERAYFLKELYIELYQVEEFLNKFISPRVDITQKKISDYQKGYDRIKIVRIQIEKNRIFVSDEFCNKIYDYLDACEDIIKETARVQSKWLKENLRIDKGEAPYIFGEQSAIDHLIKVYDKVEKDIRDLRIEVAGKFRELIGS